MDLPGPSNRSDSSSEESTEDTVIREIPIIHSKKLQDLYLFQFPFRSKTTQECFGEETVRKCMFKPENKEALLEISMDTESPNFDSGRAEFIAQEIDGDINAKKARSKEIYFENEIVDKTFLKSTKNVKDSDNYAVAAYNGREIHLSSIKDILQFRPYFPYLDKGLKRKKDILNNLSDSDDEKPGCSKSTNNAQQITVKFKQAEDPDKKGFQEMSYQALEAKKNQENWINFKWHDKDTTQSNVERLKLISDNLDDTGQGESLTREEYLKLLIPADKEQIPLEPTLPSHVLSLHALRRLPLLEQCRLLLKDAQIIQFQQIMLLLGSVEGVTAEALIMNLQKVAVLVRGNWIVKSEVLYPEKTLSASGVPAELMCRARDYILYLFTKQQNVERTKVSPLLKIRTEEVEEIFTGIAKLQPNSKGWELTLATDHDFLTKHTDLAQRQNLIWENRYHELRHFFIQPARQRRKSKSASESDGYCGKTRTSSVSCSDNDSGTESKGKSPVLSRKKITA